MKSNFFASVFFLAFSSKVLAEVEISPEIRQIDYLSPLTTAWTEEYKSSVTLFGDSASNPSRIYATAFIGVSDDGISRVAFDLGAQKMSTCSKKYDLGKEIIVSLDGQPLKAMLFCNSGMYEDFSYVRIVPHTTEGQKFIVQKLKSSKKDVDFEFQGYKWPVSTKKFAVVHKTKSKNAL